MTNDTPSNRKDGSSNRDNQPIEEQALEGNVLAEFKEALMNGDLKYERQNLKTDTDIQDTQNSAKPRKKRVVTSPRKQATQLNQLLEQRLISDVEHGVGLSRILNDRWGKSPIGELLSESDDKIEKHRRKAEEVLDLSSPQEP